MSIDPERWTLPDADPVGDMQAFVDRAYAQVGLTPYVPDMIMLSAQTFQYLQDLDAFVRVLERRAPGSWHARRLLAQWYGTRWRDRARRRYRRWRAERRDDWED